MNLREISRKEYGKRSPQPTEGEINLGSLQRIADALERIEAKLGTLADVARRVDRRLDRRSHPVKP